jgi:glycosyltransferase involved in cell wall biosynthesis
MGEGLNILLVNDYGRPMGGAELQMIAIRDALRARGHRARLFTSDAELVPGFPLLADRACHGQTGRLQVLSQTANLSAWRALRQELRENPPDIVHVRMFLWQLSPLILTLLADVPVLFQAAVYKAICPNGLKLLPDGRDCTQRAGRVCLSSGCVSPLTWASTMAQRAMVRRLRGRIDTAAALSRRMADAFEADGWRDVQVLPNGVEEGPMRPPLGPVPVVAYAGRLAREKGVGTLIDAFAQVAARHPAARLVIAGSGPDEAALRARAAPLGERVRFLGHLPRPAMEQAFAEAWVQVVPSLWQEPFGNVTTEAMMRGTAVVASDVGGQSDIVVQDQTGHLVPPGDVDALAGALADLVGSRDRAEAMGQAGRTLALQVYLRARNTDRLIEVYQMTIARFRAARGREVADLAAARDGAATLQGDGEAR